ncbi:DUF4153 domain-containing protein [Cloacibacterium sp. TD35]|uniref:DUF4153 domain-containing protein n=1 Tax=Cloacibacterium sp. TD35 TaxID=2976818 RepID=UPI00237EBBF9|nr:DUF4173 domain-containing protein [Cloacibacterium sp. TD35]WDT68257.1 DUF4173 domain-containing protein [Cloacibacterium sp. TD35]
MKTHHLIFLVTAMFVVLFYNQESGLNIGILGILVAVLTYFNTEKRFKTRTFYSVLATSILSSIAFAWYGDFASFLAIFTSLFLLGFTSKNKELKSIFVIPVFAINFVTFIYRVFQLEQWLPQRKTESFWQKILAVVLIPAFLLLIFFSIYTHGSSHFASLFSDYELDINLWQVIALSILGFFLAFNYFNFSIYEFFIKNNHYLKNDFLNEDKKLNPTYDFLNLPFERLSGVVSFVALNILLLFFIFTFNYEQFVELPKATANQLAEETHERVGAVIASIVMAIGVIMFYFKGSFNFDRQAKSLKVLAKIWVFLNAVLVISAFVKNSEYVFNLGLTYKRLGVYAFLILAIIGLIFTFIKIHQQKTNAYLFNQMVWYFYGTILVCSFINWGNLSTVYNINNGKADFKFLYSLNYNDKILQEKFPKEMAERANYEKGLNDKKPFLSKILYYETLDF